MRLKSSDGKVKKLMSLIFNAKSFCSRLRQYYFQINSISDIKMLFMLFIEAIVVMNITQMLISSSHCITALQRSYISGVSDQSF